MWPECRLRRSVLTAVAISCLLCYGIDRWRGLAFMLEAVDNTVRTPEQAQATHELAALGIIPASANALFRSSRAKGAAGEGLREAIEFVTYRRPKSDISESYRAFVPQFCFLHWIAAEGDVDYQRLPQEGKTTTSINTAVVLAQKGARVLPGRRRLTPPEHS